MKGTVAIINHKIGWIAVLTENNNFTIAEVLEYSLPELGDIISGNLESLGSETFYNNTKEEEFDVFVQDIYADFTQAKKQLEVFENNKTEWEIL
ncbi:MAG: hypothetical protein H0Z35_09145 [Thermoanaerobacteraceae bacterium]|nr:hypothetical protein [Thermoanaerobacteraceae bacterium]